MVCSNWDRDRSSRGPGAVPSLAQRGHEALSAGHAGAHFEAEQPSAPATLLSDVSLQIATLRSSLGARACEVKEMGESQRATNNNGPRPAPVHEQANVMFGA